MTAPHFSTIGAHGLFDGRLSFEHKISPLTLFIGRNEAGKSTRLGIPNLVVRGGHAGNFPVVGRAAYPWRAWADFTSDGRTVRLERRWDGAKETCFYDGVRTSVRDLDSKAADLVGTAGVWRLSDLVSLSPAARLRWIEERLMVGGSELGPWFSDSLQEGLEQLASDAEWALPELVDHEHQLAPSPATVQRIRRGTLGLLAEHDLTVDLKPKGARYVLPAIDDAPEGAAVPRALTMSILDRLRLMRKLTLAELTAARAAVKRLEQDGEPADLPPGTVAEWRERAAEVRVRIGALEAQRAEATAANTTRIAAEQSYEAAQTEYDRLRTTDHAADIARLEQEVAELTASASAMGAAHTAAEAARDAAAQRVEDLRASLAEADRALVTAQATIAQVERAQADDLLGEARGLLAGLLAQLPANLAAELQEKARAYLTATAADDTRLAQLGAEKATAEQTAEGLRVQLSAAQRLYAGHRTSADSAGAANAAKREATRLVARTLNEARERRDGHNAVLAMARDRVEGTRRRFEALKSGASLILLDEQIEVEQEAEARAVLFADRLSDSTQRRVMLDQARSDRAAAERRLSRVDEALRLFEVVLARVLQEQLGPILAPATVITRRVLDRELTLNLEGGGASFLLGGVDLDGVQGDQLRSPRIIGLTALRLAVIAQMSGFRVLSVDDAEAITATRRSAFFSSVAAAVDGGTLHQALAAIATEQVDMSVEGWHMVEIGR